MTVYIKQIYHFLGGAVFAIILIVCTALYVIAGTLMESHTGSHRYAAQFVYGTWLFGLLLWGFFINIFFAATRRWPFKRRHIPFLITHLGLLMILGGMLVKHYTGTQGAMLITEGSVTNQLMLPDTLALRIDTQDNLSPSYLQIPFNSNIQHESGSNLTLINYHPHCSERYETFIKRDWVILAGTPPFPLKTPLCTQFNQQTWTLLGKRSNNPVEDSRQAYLQNTHLIVKEPASGSTLMKLPLREAIENGILVQGDNIQVEFSSTWSSTSGWKDPQLIISINDNPIVIELQGNKALINQPLDRGLGSPPFLFDLESVPTLLFLEDPHHDITLVTIGPYGDTQSCVIEHTRLNSLYSYDHGFGGYSMQTSLRYFDKDRGYFEQQAKACLIDQLSKIPFNADNLLPPLELIHQACQKAGVDFGKTLINFLHYWNQSGGWLCQSLPGELDQIFDTLDWTTVHGKELKGCFWSAALILAMEEREKDGEKLADILETNCWPFAKEIQDDPRSSLKSYVLEMFTRQLFAAADELPDIPQDSLNNILLFSAYCRAYGVHWSSIAPTEHDSPEGMLTLECPLTTIHRIEAPTSKLEDNIPFITVDVCDGRTRQQIHLAYDKLAQGLKWPACGGNFLLRFQPQFVYIPYNVRVRRGRQICYPNSNQPFSYECDVIVTDERTGVEEKALLSMNNVHETWDGYRFYLSGMSPNDESASKQIHIVVNHDPAKYWLTYPGALILSFGIVLLFWLSKRRTPRNQK